jgi:hypothetical protein
MLPGMTTPTATHNTLRQLLGVAFIWAALKLQPLVVWQWRIWCAKGSALFTAGRSPLPVPGQSSRDL